MANQACYRKLKKYKYQLVDRDYEISIEIEERDIDTDYIALGPDGRLIIKEHYAWDGPSGPSIDTRNFMRGSLVHDALYQLMRLEKLDYKTDRKYADQLLKNICREDGMSAFRAWYVHRLVRAFGEGAAKPTGKHQDKVICVP